MLKTFRWNLQKILQTSNTSRAELLHILYNPLYTVQCTVRTLTDANKGELFLGCQSIRAGQAALF